MKLSLATLSILSPASGLLTQKQATDVNFAQQNRAQIIASINTNPSSTWTAEIPSRFQGQSYEALLRDGAGVLGGDPSENAAGLTVKTHTDLISKTGIQLVDIPGKFGRNAPQRVSFFLLWTEKAESRTALFLVLCRHSVLCRNSYVCPSFVCFSTPPPNPSYIIQRNSTLLSNGVPFVQFWQRFKINRRVARATLCLLPVLLPIVFVLQKRVLKLHAYPK